MNYGKLAEAVFDRSVDKALNISGNKSTAAQTGIALGQALASGPDGRVAVRAYMAAANRTVPCAANHAGTRNFEYMYASLTLAVPERTREAKVRGIMEAVAACAGERGIPVIGCDVQVLPCVTQAMASCTVFAAKRAHSGDGESRALPGEDIVMTKWIGLEGTAVIASGNFDALCGRYPRDLVETAADFYRYLSIGPEAATATESGASYMHVLREGGVFGGLWQLAADNGVGLVADLKCIPVRQETVEVCEFFDVNPYVLLSGGSLLITAPDGDALVRALEKGGIPAAVIGRTTAGNDRVVRHGGETRYLESSYEDSIYKYYAHISAREKRKGSVFPANKNIKRMEDYK